jgi:aspartyl-tRNA synthetase
VWKLVGHDLTVPIPRLTYREAMDRFGSDKPDLRIRTELTELTEHFAATSFRVFQAPYVGAVVQPGGAASSRREFDGWQDWARSRGARGLAYVTVEPGNELSGPVAKNLSEVEKAGLAELVGAGPGDAIFFAAGPRIAAQSLLGAARLEIARRGGLVDDDWAFVWIVDYPLFEPVEATTDVAVGGGRWTAVHHAFTAPQPAWMDRFEDDPEHALSQAYDLVCNGNEIAGGSIRIHRADVQQRVFDVMGLSADAAKEKFGFLLDAFAYGAPPHGGIAFGWDRTVALLAGSESIRDVIAFPKSGGGLDPLTGAPAPISAEQRREAGIDVVPAEASNRSDG